MSSESRDVPNCNAEGAAENNAAQSRTEQIGALGGCLLEGDAEQTQREKKVRRRALVTSTLLQAALAAVIAIPLFAKVEPITVKDWTPVPPYHPYGGAAPQHPQPPTPQPGQKTTFCLFYPARPTMPVTDSKPGGPVSDPPTIGDTGPLPGIPCEGCIQIGKSDVPVVPQVVNDKPAIVHMTHIDPAMLVERIEPVYPALAKQTRRSGRVELHAIISADGRIESLEVVSGDAIFVQSALDAVRRWKYRPTKLNDVAVKVDTYITVNYTMAE
jgi:periplasmic protein TonB